MSKEKDLTDAMENLLEGKADQAIDKATAWSETWVAKCIIFLAYSFFFYEPDTAMEIFGGPEEIKQLMSSERVERHFLQGYGALFRKEEERSESAFECAAKVLPNDPFIQFSLAFIYLKRGKINKVFDVISLMGQENAGHPLLYLLRDIVLWQKRS